MKPNLGTPEANTNLRPNQPIAHETVKTLADSIYRTLRAEGCEHRDIIGVSSQLIGLVTSAINADEAK